MAASRMKLVAAVGLLAGVATSVSGQCEPGWSPEFHAVSPAPGCMAVFDADGEGPNPPALYIGGSFTSVGPVPAEGIAMWNGAEWAPVGGGLGHDSGVSVGAMVVFDDDGPGPRPAALYVSGRFATAGGVVVNNIARWDGTAWSAVGGGLSGGAALTVFDEDGDGPRLPALFAGGSFSSAGGVPMNKLARWDGTSWTDVGGGVSGSYLPSVFALAVYDKDGDGPHPPVLCVGGRFDFAGGVPAGNIAAWNGEGWSALGAGVGNPPSIQESVVALAAYDSDGPGPLAPVLWVGGDFTKAGGQPAVGLASWNGSQWSDAGSPLTRRLGGQARVYELTVLDGDVPGTRVLYAGGWFDLIAGQPGSGLAQWDGVAWRPVGASSLDNEARAVARYDDDGPGPSPARLYVGGPFNAAGGVRAQGFAAWDGASWQSLDTAGKGIRGGLEVLLSIEDGAPGPHPGSLIAAGQFTLAGQTAATQIARWDGTRWWPLGEGISQSLFGQAYALVIFDDDGPGPRPPALYAGGNFVAPGGFGRSIARWDGTEWTPLGVVLNSIHAMAVYDEDGDGPAPPALFVGGQINRAGSVNTRGIARWNGTAWSSVGGGTFNNSDVVRALAVYDEDGDGPGRPALFAGGDFLAIGTTNASRIARWNGTAWSAVGSGIPGGIPVGMAVYAMTVMDDDGPGPRPEALFVGGRFGSAGGQPANNIARWDGTAWSSLGDGLTGGTNSFAPVFALRAVDTDGAGPTPPALYAGGTFTSAGGTPVRGLARWDGAAWSDVGGGVVLDSSGLGVYALASYDDDGPGPGLPALYVGGPFRQAGDVPSSSIARWGCPPACRADWDASGQIDPSDVSLFVSVWLTSLQAGTLGGDFNRSGVVDPVDVSAFVAAWFDALINGC